MWDKIKNTLLNVAEQGKPSVVGNVIRGNPWNLNLPKFGGITSPLPKDAVLAGLKTPKVQTPKIATKIMATPTPTLTPTPMPKIATKLAMPSPAPIAKPTNSLIAKYFPEDPRTANAIAMQESSLRPTARNYLPQAGVDAIGLMQINLPAHLDKVPGNTYAEKVQNLMNPEINLKVAREIYNASHWNPWEAYTSGAYKKYLK